MGAIGARLAQPAALTWRETAAAYVSLTKPRIISLLLITTIPTMILAAEGWPSTWLVLATVIGGSLAAGGANAINCYLDRDIDQSCTEHRAAAAAGQDRSAPCARLRGCPGSSPSSCWR
jgi:protoheme IX farnesyltransferase